MYKHLNRLIIILLFCTLFFSCKDVDLKFIEAGVSEELAELREKQLGDIKYYLSFYIPDSTKEKLKGNVLIDFKFNHELKQPLILDFRNPELYVKSVKIDNEDVNYKFKNEHIIIPPRKLKNGRNQISIEFISSDRALNRNKEYLYTLFVPDRACTAFPCFDQPSLKAKFQTEINVPNDWASVANTPLVKQLTDFNSRKIFVFDETEPIPTYVYSFVAGKFKAITKNYDGRKMTLYHREDDSLKLKRNVEKIFSLHYSSLEWLEEYTQIDYPFKKFDFVIIPSFQYSGMEHPGAILYRDSRLFLESNATIREKLNRANLIAHETAHMWFGDLVTMEWFSEVWLKEVFANFIAGKIVNPQFQDVNHSLNFIINHYPPSYAIDRTKGANPIEQKLGNMKNAGTLYGNIIYHKAPIIMSHLEKIIGEEKLKEGIQEYLNNNKFGNATWNDLIQILDEKAKIDLRHWSQVWVNEPGMPHYKVQKAYDTNDNLQSIIIEQLDPSGKGRQWHQEVEILIGDQKHQLILSDTFNVLSSSNGFLNPKYIFPNSNGFGYGYFEIDSLSVHSILQESKYINDPVLRCSMYISLWENMLNQNIKPNNLFISFINALETESNPQNINLLLGYIKTCFWKFSTENYRLQNAARLEGLLWNKILNAKPPGLKLSYFKAYKSIVITDVGVNKLYGLWSKETILPGFELSEQDLTEISFELAIRGFSNSEDILSQQLERITNSEKRKRFLFIKPATSKDIEIRDSFFENLKDEKNREKEPWVIDALYYLHHPLRTNESVKYIRPSLDILEELQITGDIFFPKRWLDATFHSHNSIDAVLDINLFFNENPGFPENLKNKALQSTDLVLKASIINEE